MAEALRRATDGEFVRALTDGDRVALEHLAIRRRLRRGAIIFLQGERSDRVVIVLDGRVKVSYDTADGKEVVLAVRGRGELLGELSAIDGEPRSATVSALDDVDALVIGSGEFTGFLEDRPRLILLLLRMLARRIRDADRKRIEFAAQDSIGRLAKRLVELADEYGVEAGDGGVRIQVPLSQQELAGWTGSSREAVSKALRILRARGWVSTQRRAIVLHDVDAMRRRAAT